jgi:hypothetical protein
VHADAEHQEDHADLGELAREVGVADEPGGEGPDGDAGEQVADQRRQPQAPREHAEHEGQAEAGREQDEQVGLVFHGHPRNSGATGACVEPPLLLE